MPQSSTNLMELHLRSLSEQTRALITCFRSHGKAGAQGTDLVETECHKCIIHTSHWWGQINDVLLFELYLFVSARCLCTTTFAMIWGLSAANQCQICTLSRCPSPVVPGHAGILRTAAREAGPAPNEMIERFKVQHMPPARAQHPPIKGGTAPSRI
jgi:hypothetical protein